MTDAHAILAADCQEAFAVRVRRRKRLWVGGFALFFGPPIVYGLVVDPPARGDAIDVNGPWFIVLLAAASMSDGACSIIYLRKSRCPACTKRISLSSSRPTCPNCGVRLR
jgi:hypothetical protein